MTNIEIASHADAGKQEGTERRGGEDPGRTRAEGPGRTTTHRRKGETTHQPPKGREKPPPEEYMTKKAPESENTQPHHNIMTRLQGQLGFERLSIGLIPVPMGPMSNRPTRLRWKWINKQ